ncbi:hypothetical protein CSUI_008382 [Cystoisospora suis]|uniref:Uncharacterized protein n=1 Tax=Cystoisospora suis TaxID=483139 RepID=A0A2C6KN27_9APIC|nr:hypothetical protein CSUI_008382 [Cystoisospora suis]
MNMHASMRAFLRVTAHSTTLVYLSARTCLRVSVQLFYAKVSACAYRTTSAPRFHSRLCVSRRVSACLYLLINRFLSINRSPHVRPCLSSYVHRFICMFPTTYL